MTSYPEGNKTMLAETQHRVMGPFPSRNSTRPCFFTAICLAALPAFSAAPPLPQQSDTPSSHDGGPERHAPLEDASKAKWWMQIGPAWRGGMNVSVNGASYVQRLGLHAAASPLQRPVGIGSQNSYADRTYDDGYVKIDSGTLNPDAVGGMGNTWNWAYDNAAQYDATASSLAFHSQGVPGFASSRNSFNSTSDEMLGTGLQFQVGLPLHKSGRWSLDFCVGFQAAWNAQSQMESTPYTERVNRLNVTDSYDVAGVAHPDFGFPTPRTTPGGYVGTYGGPTGGSSTWVGGFPVIGNQPSSRTQATDTLAFAQNKVNVELQMNFYEVTFSPQIRYEVTEAISLHFTPKFGFAYMVATAERSESFSVKSGTGGAALLGYWHDQSDEKSFRFATGITAGLDLAIGRGFLLGVFGGYEWAVNPVQFEVGPSVVSVNGSGFVVGAIVGKEF